MSTTERLGISLVIVAMATASACLAFAAGCARRDDAPAREPPKPQDVLRRFNVGQVIVAEFRDSSGRVCVLAGTVSGDGRGGRAQSSATARPLPPLEYDALPEPPLAIEPSGSFEGPGKRPL